MKSYYGFSLGGVGVIIVLALTIVFSGCTQPSSPSPAVTPATSGQASPGAVPLLVPASLPYGVTISIPSDWQREDTHAMGVMDYGKDTTNIARFVSPNEVPGNPVSSNSLSVDIDQNVQQAFDTYFNNATIALGKTYGTQMQAHSITLKIGGYDTYELDFQSVDVKGSYFFTNTQGTIYIFAFKGPTKPLAVQALNSEITDMYKSIQLNPPAPVVQKTR